MISTIWLWLLFLSTSTLVTCHLPIYNRHEMKALKPVPGCSDPFPVPGQSSVATASEWIYHSCIIELCIRVLTRLLVRFLKLLILFYYKKQNANNFCLNIWKLLSFRPWGIQPLKDSTALTAVNNISSSSVGLKMKDGTVDILWRWPKRLWQTRPAGRSFMVNPSICFCRNHIHSHAVPGDTLFHTPGKGPCSLQGGVHFTMKMEQPIISFQEWSSWLLVCKVPFMKLDSPIP